MRRLSTFDSWFVVVFLVLGRMAQLVLMGMAVAILIGAWKP